MSRRANCGPAEARERVEYAIEQLALAEIGQGRKSPTLHTLDRLLAAAGYVLEARPRIDWTAVEFGQGRVAWVPSTLPRLDPAEALREVTLPLELDWSHPGRAYDLRDRNQRARIYEIVLREGGPEQISSLVDGVLLADLWADLVLPTGVRDAWAGLVVEPLTHRP